MGLTGLVEVRLSLSITYSSDIVQGVWHISRLYKMKQTGSVGMPQTIVNGKQGLLLVAYYTTIRPGKYV